MSEEDQPPRRRRRNIGAAIASTAIVVAGIVIIARKPIAEQVIDAKLRGAGVPYSYRLRSISPVRQTLDDVRLGDPAHPDLVARRIIVHWRYRLGWPVLSAVRVEGARLRGRWQDGRLSLGSLDRLLPKSGGGGPLLPDMNVAIVDGLLSLLTPAGAVQARIGGAGNLASGFHGRLALAAPALAVGGCAIEGLRADVALASEARSPLVKGPVAIDRAICPTRALELGQGRIGVDARLAPDLGGAEGRVMPVGLAGHLGNVGFGAFGGSLSGRIARDGGAGTADLRVASLVTRDVQGRDARAVGAWRLDKAGPAYTGELHLAALAGPARLRDRVTRATASAAGTPVGPVADRIGGVIADLLRGARVDADVAFAAGGLHVDGATLRGRHSAITIAGLYALAANGGWRAEGELAEAGSALPPMQIQAERRSPTAPLSARIDGATFTAPGARLAVAQVRILGGRFATAAVIDGPIGAGRIEGLRLPIVGRVDESGVRIGEGCTAVGFERLAISGVRLDPARFRICGAPVVAGGPGGMRISAEVRDLKLTGASGSAPLTLAAGRLAWAGNALHGERIAARLGAGDDPTRLDLAAIEGAPGPAGFAGKFAGAEGSIGHVPLALSGGTGDWRLEGGRLRLGGAITVADRDASPRFRPMASRDVALALVDGRITGTAGLTALGRTELVTKVTLHHNLATGSGDAMLDVPGIVFRKGGLQPEMLTPLTLGVVANAVGTVAGQGRIAWNARATRSSGDFHTDRMDLAAAFGPVTGIATRIHFTDLLGMVSEPHQEARIASVNPGVVVADGVAHYQLLPGNRIAVEDARWPFAGGTLTLAPSTLDFSRPTERYLTFTIRQLDAATFIQQLDFPNVSATGTFDGSLPMIFDTSGGRIEGGSLVARAPGTLAYVGQLSNEQIGTMGKLAFDALKAIRYSTLSISLDGRLDGEIVSKVKFEGVRQATGAKGIVARAIRNLPFRFNIAIRAPFRGLVGSARAYSNPELLLQNVQAPPVQPAASAPKP